MSSKSGNRFTTGSLVLQRPHAQPLAGEVVDQRVGFWIGQHALDLFLQHGRILELALRGEVDQLIVGNAAPQEEGQREASARSLMR